jgi:hypothetical protein
MGATRRLALSSDFFFLKCAVDGLLDGMRALFRPRPCPVCDGHGEVPQRLAAERLAAEVIGKARG